MGSRERRSVVLSWDGCTPQGCLAMSTDGLGYGNRVSHQVGRGQRRHTKLSEGGSVPENSGSYLPSTKLTVNILIFLFTFPGVCSPPAFPSTGSRQLRTQEEGGRWEQGCPNSLCGVGSPRVGCQGDTVPSALQGQLIPTSLWAPDTPITFPPTPVLACRGTPQRGVALASKAWSLSTCLARARWPYG